MLRSASRHEAAQATIQRSGLRQMRGLRGAPADRLARALMSWQALAAVTAAAAVDAILAEQQINAPRVAPVVTAAQAGSASDGRSLVGLFTAAGAATNYEFDRIVLTQLQDVARSTLATDIAARPKVDGYTRQIQAGACSRCAILAGAFYRWNDGFERHPNCNCEHIPTRRDVASETVTDVNAYFASLSPEEQDRIFTKAGAEAIRLGADPAQVVNARRGMNTAQPTVRVIGQRERHLDIAGKRITTYEPITETVVPSRRRLVRDESGLYTTDAGRRGLGLARGEQRLMPESILEMSGGDRDRALEGLRRYGYIR